MKHTNTITCIGWKNAGKTALLIGTYLEMSGWGKNGYTIVPEDNQQYQILEGLSSNLTKGNFPQATNNSEEYSFNILLDATPMFSFVWNDYPGGILLDTLHEEYPQLKSQILNTDCLLMLLDGEAFAFQATTPDAYKNQLKRNLHYYQGFRVQANTLKRMVWKDKLKIPALCIVITKSDLIRNDYAEVIEEVLCSKLSSLIKASDLAMITAVSLGKDIKAGKFAPSCIEEPAVIGILMILWKYIQDVRGQSKSHQQAINQKVFPNAPWNLSDTERRKSCLINLSEQNDVWIKRTKGLLDVFDENKKIYVRGEEKNFRDYMERELLG